MVKKDNKKKTKSKFMIGCLGFLATIVLGCILIVAIGSSIEDNRAEKQKNIDQKTKETKNNTKDDSPESDKWKLKINEIRELDIPLDRKQHEATMMAIDYKPSKSELTSFYKDILVEYEKQSYIQNPKDEGYILENTFKAYVIHTHDKDTNVSDIGYYYWENMKLVYQGKELVDSPEIKSNEIKLRERLPNPEKSRKVTIETKNTTWKQGVDSITKKNLNKNEEEVQATRLARNYKPTEEELSSFLKDITKDFVDEKYKTHVNEDFFAIESIFKAYVLHKHSQDKIVQDVGYDYYQIVRDVYRGYEDLEGEFVTYNVKVIQNNLQKIE